MMLLKKIGLTWIEWIAIVIISAIFGILTFFFLGFLEYSDMQHWGAVGLFLIGFSFLISVVRPSTVILTSDDDWKPKTKDAKKDLDRVRIVDDAYVGEKVIEAATGGIIMAVGVYIVNAGLKCPEKRTKLVLVLIGGTITIIGGAFASGNKIKLSIKGPGGTIFELEN